MQPFSYERPERISEASRLLGDLGTEARLLAGGTDLVVGLRDGSVHPRLVVDVKHIAELAGPPIVLSEGAITFSALAVMRQIESDPDVLATLPALAEAARVVGSVQIRHRATLAGNVCNASPAADTLPPLLVYGAQVEVAGRQGQRSVPIDEFILGSGQTALGQDELVTAIVVPLPAADLGAAYTRLVRRRGTDLASVTMCAAVDGRGGLRLSYGSVGPRPLLVTEEEGLLTDPATSPADREGILDALLSAARPSATSLRAGPEYRRAMLRVLARRAIGEAMARRRDAGVA